MRYAMGELLLDLEASNLRLKHAGTLITADERAVRLLHCLIQHHPVGAEIDQILDEVWPEFAVTEQVLFRLVADLRQRLDRVGFNGNLIQSIHNKDVRGFRLAIAKSDLRIVGAYGDNVYPLPCFKRFKSTMAAILFVSALGVLGSVWQEQSQAKRPAAVISES